MSHQPEWSRARLICDSPNCGAEVVGGGSTLDEAHHDLVRAAEAAGWDITGLAETLEEARRLILQPFGDSVRVVDVTGRKFTGRVPRRDLCPACRAKETA